MSQPELLKIVTQALAAARIEYMLTGSVAASFQGEPRSTHDIDLVVAFSEKDIPTLLAAFPPPDYYLSKTAMIEAIDNQTMFNLHDNINGGKVDFWMLTSTAFDQTRFARRSEEEVDGATIFITSPEDTIVAKLRWAEMSGGSEKQFHDVLRVYELQFHSLDMDYIKSWTKQLNLESWWNRLQSEAQPLLKDRRGDH